MASGLVHAATALMNLPEPEEMPGGGMTSRNRRGHFSDTDLCLYGIAKKSLDVALGQSYIRPPRRFT